MEIEEFFQQCFSETMQKFVSSWNDSQHTTLTPDVLSNFILAGSLFSFCEKFNFTHPEHEHAATLLNQAAAQLGLEEKF